MYVNYFRERDIVNSIYVQQRLHHPKG